MRDPGRGPRRDASDKTRERRPSVRPALRLGERDLSDLIGAIYSAALNPAEWPICLDDLARRLGAFLPGFFTHDVRTDRGEVPNYPGIDLSLQRQYAAYFAERNVLLTHGHRLLVPGTVRTSQMMCDYGILLSSEYYNDFMRRLGMHHALGATIRSDESRTYNLTMFRQPGAEPFADRELRFVKALLPHFQRAFGIVERMAAVEVRASAVVDALDRIHDGIMLVSADGRIILTNRVADTILRAADGLVSDRSGLACARPAESRALREAIALAAQTSAGESTSAGQAFSLPRPSGQRSLSVIVSPIRFKDAWQPDQRRIAAVFVRDPEMDPHMDEEQLGRIHELTPAEARIAAAIAKGDTVEATSVALGVSLHTVRTHLKRIFLKTGTTRQAELVRLLLEGSPRLEI